MLPSLPTRHITLPFCLATLGHILLLFALLVAAWWRIDRLALPARALVSASPGAITLPTEEFAPALERRPRAHVAVPPQTGPAISKREARTRHRNDDSAQSSRQLAPGVAPERTPEISEALLPALATAPSQISSPEAQAAHSGELRAQEGEFTSSSSHPSERSSLQALTGPSLLSAQSTLSIFVKDKRTGDITVRMRIDADGRPTDFRIIKALSPDLDSQALAVARDFRFTPCRNAHGVPVSCNLDWTFHVRSAP